MKKREIDTAKFIQTAQVGGIEAYTIADGAGCGSRVLLFNTGGGLRFRVLVDRGFDIDQAFFHEHSLAFLTHKGATAPSESFNRGIDWLKGFPGGLLTSCGPLNYGPPVTEGPWELGLHGSHSNTPASVESIIQPDPHRKQIDFSATAVLRYGQLFGPNLRLRRTIACTLGSNVIRFIDEFINDANTPCEHAWLLHINFGYPLVDEGTELCHAGIVSPRDDAASKAFFAKEARKIISAPLEDHRAGGEAVAFVRPVIEDGRATVGLINDKLSFGVAVRYDPKQFPNCANWQHLGPGEYVVALEPMTGTLAGRDKDRDTGDLVTIERGATRSYDYTIEVLNDPDQLKLLRQVNTEANRSSS